MVSKDVTKDKWTFQCMSQRSEKDSLKRIDKVNERKIFKFVIRNKLLQGREDEPHYLR